MKRVALLFAIISCIAMGSFAQNVLVSGAVTGNGLYPTLGAAFTAINSGAQTSAVITVSIVGNTTETGTATLNQGTWTSLTISPSGGAARTISGNLATLITLDGADQVIINGLNTGGNSLTLDNTNTGTAATLHVINDAQNIQVLNTALRGANTSTASGTLFLDAGTVSGNDNYTISGCTFTASGASFPVQHIYSAGTAGMENSNITITGCYIADFFHADLSSCGIFASTGSDAWIISNNRFYQTGTRTYTTANTHRAILLSTGSGHTISGNTIGYSSSAGTGTYTMDGTVATRFAAIELSAGTSATSGIQGNIITAISLGTTANNNNTSGILCGINILSGNVNAGTVTPNIIGSSSGINTLTATPTVSGGVVIGIHSASTGTVNIQNNTIGGISCSGTTAGITGGVFGINISGVAGSMNISGNIIGNASADNIRGGTNGLTAVGSPVCGIMLAALPTTCTVSSNTIQNLSSYGTGTASTGYVRGIQTPAATGNPGTATITGNTISNLSTSSGLMSITSGQASVAGINIGAGTNMVVSNNIIYNLANLNTNATQRYVAGITHGNATNTTISGNRIYGLSCASTSTTATTPGVAVGIVVRSGASAVTIYNNMISLGSGQTSNTAFVGIQNNDGSTPDPTSTNIYYNTILITGTASAGAMNTWGYLRGDFSTASRNVTIDFRDNLVVNERTGGTGQHFAIGNNHNATASATGWGTNACNYNILNAAANTLGYWNGALSFSAWRTASAGDANSFTNATVTFVNNADNLHLNMGTTPNLMESNAQAIAGITTDYDNQARPGPVGSVNGGAIAPDIGADEFDGVILDITPPIITYTPLSFTCDTSSRTFTATITDLSGVNNTALYAPRVYFRKNAGTWQNTQGTLVSANTWSFTISSALMGSVTPGDIIQYYVIAQDLNTPAFNIGSNPSAGLAATDVNNVSSPPSTPSSYPISGTLNGTYTVGVGGDYTTLTDAVYAYNNNCLGGPVIFSLTDAGYPSETFPITINANTDASAVNTLTIHPASGVSTSISGASATGLLVLSGADYVTIDGSNSNTANSICPPVSATRDLTLVNTSTASATAVIWVSSLGSGAGARHNTIRNCIIRNGADLSQQSVENYGIVFTGSSLTVAPPTDGADNHYNTVENNFITKCAWGIFIRGSVSASNTGNHIMQNLIGPSAFGSEQLRRGGIVLQCQDSAVVSANEVRYVGSLTADLPNGNDRNGIALGGYDGPAPVTTSFTNGTVTGNYIHDIVEEKTFSAIGLQLAASNTAPTNNLLANNMIANVRSNATSPDFGIGLHIYSGNNDNVLFHTVSMISADRDPAGSIQAAQPDIGIKIFTNALNLFLQNNIAHIDAASDNSITNYALAAPGGYSWSSSDYNDYSVNSSNPQCTLFGLGVTGFTPVNTLAAWQATFTPNQDANSLNIVPVFTSNADPHLVAGSNTALEDMGNPFAAINTDIDCDIRDNTCAVDIGADETGTPREINVQGNTVNIPDGNITTSISDFTDFGTQSVCNGMRYRNFVIQNLGTTPLYIDSIRITGTNAADFGFTTATLSYIAPGADSTLGIVFDPGMSGMHQATIIIYSNDCTEGTYDFAISGTGTELSVTGITGTNISCNGADDGSAALSTSGGISPLSYDWLPGSPSGDGTSSITNLGPGIWSCIVTDTNGCTDTATVIITEPAAITGSQSFTICFGESITVGSNIYTTTGIFTDVLVAANGCDSTVTTDLTVNAAIDVSTVRVNETITANASGAMYQWIDCDNNNSPLAGETGQSFTATVNGNYAVIITVNNCSDTSACVNINSVGLENPGNMNSAVQVYPNPNTGWFTLSTENYALQQVEIFNGLGEKVYSRQTQSAQIHINISYLPAGLYYLKAIGEKEQRIVKVIVK